MLFFEGGMTYSDLMSIPIPELSYWIEIANKLAREQKNAIESARRK